MSPEVSILVSTFQRPRHLEYVLESIRQQRNVDGRMEVVVSDDGSRDSTHDIVERFIATCPFPVKFTTHQHDGFRLAQCRNEGVTASTAPYLLFLDGDCLIPPDHVEKHLKRRRPGVVNGGYCIRLSQQESAEVGIEDITKGSFTRLGGWHERASLLALGIKSHFYNWIQHRSKPRLFGGNIGISRYDYERVNGYDERYHGWGCEDDDLRLRLRMAGVRIESILPWTRTWHLWHALVESKPENWSEGSNVGKLHQEPRLSCCMDGLVKRNCHDIAMRVIGDELLSSQLLSHAPFLRLFASNPEIEILACPTFDRFSDDADCNVLVAPGDTVDGCSSDVLRSANIVIAQQRPSDFRGQFMQFESSQAVLRAVLNMFHSASTGANIKTETWPGGDRKHTATAVTN